MPKNPHADFTPALEGYSGQGKFRFWCQMALPLTYDDSLSYYELLCKVVNYLNHTIEDVANAETNVSRLAEAYTQLQNYVNNYFDDLDIEAELRNVLDAMAEDGTLDDLLDPLVQDHLPAVVDEQIDDVVADQIGDAVAGQIGDVVAEQLPPLVEEGIPDEVSDWLTENVDPVGSAVVVDSSLTISGAAADAKVTGDELADLKTQLTETQNRIYEKQEGENLLNPLLEEAGSLNSDGTVDSTATAYATSGYIELEANENYTFTNYNATTGLIATSRKYVALYDANKQFISGSYQNVNGANYVAFSSGENAKYCRVTSTATNRKFVKKGSTAPTSFVAYENPEYINKLDFADESIPESAINYESDYIKKENINLYDSSEDVVGFILGTGGIDTSGTQYKTTGFIKVKDGFSYTISPRCRAICVFDSDKTLIPAQYDNVEKTAPFDFVALNDGYIRISYNINYGMDSVESSYNGLLTQKTEEGIALSNTQLKQVRETAFAPNILWGKKWAVCGDSFTNDGGTGTTIQDGKYAGKSYTYPWIIGNRQNMDIVQFFGGGRTLAFPAEPGDFVNSLTCPSQSFYYQNIPSDADYITIYLGINDDHHRTGGGDGEDPTGVIPLGTVDDTTTATYLGAWNVVLTWLITNRPNAHIGIIVTNGIANNDKYRLGQIAIAEKYGIPYIDLNGDTRTPAMLRTSNPNIPAAVKTALIAKWAVNPGTNEHPNDAAQLFESTFIENFLRSL